MVYFRSDWLAPRNCFGSPDTLTYQCKQLKSSSAHAWPEALWSYCYHPRQHCWIWGRMWQQQAQFILSSWVRATSWPYADPRSATRLLNLYTPCRGKPGLRVRALENTCHQNSRRDQLQESCYIHTRRNVEGEVSTTAPRHSHAVFPTGRKHTRTCHCLAKLKKFNKMYSLYRNRHIILLI